MNAYALVGVVTNKYRYVKMTYNAASGIPASKTVHVVGDNSNNGEGMPPSKSYSFPIPHHRLKHLRTD